MKSVNKLIEFLESDLNVWACIGIMVAWMINSPTVPFMRNPIIIFLLLTWLATTIAAIAIAVILRYYNFF